MTDTTEKVVDTKLVDFDWQIKHVMGSSNLRSLEDTLTQITFHTSRPIRDSANQVARNFTIEFNKTELKSFISSLQNMNDSC